MAGTKPADPIRFGSSNDADIRLGVRDSCMSEMPFWRDPRNPRQVPFSLTKGHFPVYRTVTQAVNSG